MFQPDREVEPFFSQPIRQITMMSVVLVAFGVGAYIAYPRVAPVFLSNPYLNGFILFVFVIGLIACIWQVVELIRSVSWIMAFTRANSVPEGQAPRLLAPLAALMRSRGARVQISSSSQRSILESVSTRIEEARDITRYITNLLIFLGLLGTFYGLATTVPAVVDTIRSLAPKQGETAVEVFGQLMKGLEGQLGGMGTAFASSLLGLAGSLVIGIQELFASHGQNRFYRELEDWLSSITRLGLAGTDAEGGGDASVINALIEHMAEQMEALQILFSNSDVGRTMVDERLGQVANSVERLTDRLTGEVSASASLERVARAQERLLAEMAGGNDQGAVLASLAEGQERLIAQLSGMSQQTAALERIAAGQERLTAHLAAVASPAQALDRLADGQERLISQLASGGSPAGALQRLAEGQERLVGLIAKQAEAGGAGVDAESRMRLRSIDVQLLRILEELSAGRQESLADLRADLATLIKTIRTQGGAGPVAPAAHVRRG